MDCEDVAACEGCGPAQLLAPCSGSRLSTRTRSSSSCRRKSSDKVCPIGQMRSRSSYCRSGTLCVPFGDGRALGWSTVSVRSGSKAVTRQCPLSAKSGHSSLGRIRNFVWARRTNVRKVFFTRSAERPEIGTPLGKAETPVWTSLHDVGVGVVLAIVFPIADSTNFKSATFAQRLVAAARTAKWKYLKSHCMPPLMGRKGCPLSTTHIPPRLKRRTH